MVGSWLIKDLLGAGAHVVALILDHDPQSELVRSVDRESRGETRLDDVESPLGGRLREEPDVRGLEGGEEGG